MIKPHHAIAVALLAACLSACGAAPPEPAARAQLSQDEILAEYQQETEELELAVDDAWVTAPPELALVSPDPARPMRYEQGVGAQTAQFQWYCSWARQALVDADPAASLTRLEQFSAMTVWADMDSNGHYLFSRNLEEAQAGDLDALSGYVDEYCPEQ